MQRKHQRNKAQERRTRRTLKETKDEQTQTQSKRPTRFQKPKSIENELKRPPYSSFSSHSNTINYPIHLIQSQEQEQEHPKHNTKKQRNISTSKRKKKK